MHLFSASQTQVYFLEGNYPNRWTTNTCLEVLQNSFPSQILKLVKIIVKNKR